MKYSMKKIFAVAVTIFGVTLFSGCASINATKTTSLPSQAKILVMPPHDVVQGGKPHVVGKGSGEKLQRSIQREFSSMSDYQVSVFQANETFKHTEAFSRDAAVAESVKQGSNYCLILTLGEFRNAAPMTFRTDFVTLSGGVLIDVNTKQEVWTLREPLLLEKTNIGNHYGLIDEIARFVAQSISK